MKKKETKLGIISTLLSLVPVIGMVAVVSYSNENPGTQEIPIALKLFAQITTGFIPILGLMLGLIGLLLSTRRALSVMGMIFNIFWIIFSIIFYLPQFTPNTENSLPSDRGIKIENITRVTSDRGPALAITYYTDVSFNDLDELKSEAEYVWSEYRDRVEQEGVKTAFVCPSERPVGFISKTTSYWFCYALQDDGIWDLMPETNK
jgi:hypothetical protein